MPAANIIAIHEMVRNSGSSSLRPSLMGPKWLSAMTMTKATKIVLKSTKDQPSLSSTKPRVASATVENDSEPMVPHSTTASATTAATPVTIQLIGACLVSSDSRAMSSVSWTCSVMSSRPSIMSDSWVVAVSGNGESACCEGS